MQILIKYYRETIREDFLFTHKTFKSIISAKERCFNIAVNKGNLGVVSAYFHDKFTAHGTTVQVAGPFSAAWNIINALNGTSSRPVNGAVGKILSYQ